VPGTDVGQVLDLATASSVEWNLWWLTVRDEIGEARMRRWSDQKWKERRGARVGEEEEGRRGLIYRSWGSWGWARTRNFSGDGRRVVAARIARRPGECQKP
jgi:hypothetical protein